MPGIPFYATKEDLKEIINYINNEEDLAFIVPNGDAKWIAKKSVEFKEIDQNRTHYIWNIPSGPFTIPVCNTLRDHTVRVTYSTDETRAEVSFNVPGSPSDFGICGYKVRLSAGASVDIDAGTMATVHHLESISRFSDIKHDFFQIEAIVKDPFLGWKEIDETLKNTWKGVQNLGDANVQVFGLSFTGHDNKTDLPLHHFGWIGNYYSVIGHPAKPETKKRWESLRRWVKKHGIPVQRGGPNCNELRNLKPDTYAFKGAQEKFKGGAIADIN